LVALLVNRADFESRQTNIIGTLWNICGYEQMDRYAYDTTRYALFARKYAGRLTRRHYNLVPPHSRRLHGTVEKF
jgi:hypothetical protein